MKKRILIQQNESEQSHGDRAGEDNAGENMPVDKIHADGRFGRLEGICNSGFDFRFKYSMADGQRLQICHLLVTSM